MYVSCSSVDSDLQLSAFFSHFLKVTLFLKMRKPIKQWTWGLIKPWRVIDVNVLLWWVTDYSWCSCHILLLSYNSHGQQRSRGWTAPSAEHYYPFKYDSSIAFGLLHFQIKYKDKQPVITDNGSHIWEDNELLQVHHIARDCDKWLCREGLISAIIMAS